MNGNEVIPLEYDWVGHFSEGMVAVVRGGKWGFISVDSLGISIK
jgi:hypothetical protein